MSDERIKLANDFCMGLEGRFDTMFAALAEDVEYWNVPWKPLTGVDAARSFLSAFLDCEPSMLLRMEILRSASTGNLVMNERMETWGTRGVTIHLPAAGAFEIEDGKIRKWRDYFDPNVFAPIMEAMPIIWSYETLRWSPKA